IRRQAKRRRNPLPAGKFRANEPAVARTPLRETLPVNPVALLAPSAGIAGKPAKQSLIKFRKTLRIGRLSRGLMPPIARWASPRAAPFVCSADRGTDAAQGNRNHVMLLLFITAVL